MYLYEVSDAYIELTVFMLIVNAFLLIKICLTEESGSNERNMMWLIGSGSACIVLDAVCVAASGHMGRIGFYGINALYYLNYLVIVFALFVYTLKYYSKFQELSLVQKIGISIPALVEVIFTVISYWTGWAIYVDSEGNYSRGPIYMLYVGLGLSYIVTSIVISTDYFIRARKRGSEAAFPLIYSVPVLLGPIVQFAFPYIPATSMGLTFTFLCVLINYQELRIIRSHNTIQLLGALCSNYESIHIADLDEEKFYTLRNASGIELFSGSNKTDNYQYVVRKIINRFVVPEERKAFLKFMDINSMRKRIKNKKHFSYRYTVIPDDRDNYAYEMQGASISDKSNRNLVVFGTKCIDETLKIERAEGQYITALLHDCSYFYDFDVTTGIIDGEITTREDCDPLYGLNIEFPISYNDFNNIRTKELGFLAVTYKESTYWTVEGLKAAYVKGKRVVEIRHKSTTLGKSWNANIVLSEEPGSHHLHAIYVCKDMTELVMAEEKFKQELKEALKEARRANAAKSQFLSKMSHDIRTPLNGIIGLMEISERHPEDVELLSANRKKAKVAANHLLSLINDVLDMSKLEDDKTELINEPFNIYDLCVEVLTICNIKAKENGILVENDGGHNLRYQNVYGSSLHLKQVLMNIINNAIKYNKPGGKINCSTELVECDGQDVWYKFVVSDTGIGIGEEYLEHIFEPFTQERNDARSRYQGTGLGMAIVKALVDKMAGTISVESEVGVGTTFKITIPFKINHQVYKDEKLITNKEASVQGMRILLVEDNELNLEIAKCLLEEAGAVVDIAENGEEACSKFEESSAGTYDVILMDIMMPLLDGYGASQRIRQMKKDDALTIPIVAMSANAFAEDVANAKASGMNEHLAKPIDVDKLMQVLVKYRNV